MGRSFFTSFALRVMFCFLLCLPAGCSVLAVADAGVSVVATTVKAGASVAGAVVDAVLPNKDKK